MGTVMFSIHGLALAVALAAGPQQAAAQAPAAEPQDGAQRAGATRVNLGVSIDKIQRALSRPPAITREVNRPVFRIEVIAPKPTIEDILGPDYLVGPVPNAGMTHQEFLSMVTPAEYRGMAMFTNKEAMTIAATSAILQWTLMKAVDKLKAARTERQKDAARQEVLAAMNELAEARKKAGLPPK